MSGLMSDIGQGTENAEPYVCLRLSCPCHKESPVSQSPFHHPSEDPALVEIDRTHNNETGEELEPVSQSVEGWEKEMRASWGQEYHRPEGFVVRPEEANMNADRIADWWIGKLSTTLSTLVKEMEKEMKSTENCACEGVDGGSCIGECDVSFNQGISAAVEVVNRLNK